ncbi:hypothetical protein [Halorientalis litorea]|jgi:hypothetical protein|uniref:hypothetical protein n=1 Tax=Halorientalis litorea TaxID=2931977 RepID=UPI001FF527E8|nr:hypothetical protein [Halorientalis litorea]
MDVLGDLVARERRAKEPLVYSAASQPYTAHKFCTDAWKAANLFRYHGVGDGRPVALADEARPQTLLAFFGAALIGSSARFGFPPATDARVAVGPVAAVEPLPPDGGLKRVAIGGEPESPDVIHFERDIWSENPTMPPDQPSPEATVLTTAEAAYSHADLLGAAARVVDSTGIDDGDAVAVRAPLAHPGTVVAGVLAPLSVGAELLLPGTDQTGTVAVADGDAPETTVVSPDDAAP